MINILWIEDNPLLSKNSIKIDGIEYFIPSINIASDLKQHFNLKVLQHPEEIKEFLELCHAVVSQKGNAALGNTNFIVPDIIVFDYMLSDNFNTRSPNCISYHKDNRKVREIINPNYELLKSHDDLFHTIKLFSENCLNYTKDDFFSKLNESDADDKTIEKDIENTANDEFGLFAGISVLRFFKDHITCAIPATFKENKSQIDTVSKYFEWLNEYDLKGAFKRTQRSDKNWNSIIKDSVVLLKNRITEQLQSGKLHLDLKNLTEIQNGTSNCLNIISSFETKSLPLQALFFEEDESQRNTKAKEFATKLFEKIVVNVSDFKVADEKANLLWGSYCSPKSAYRRKLSDLLARSEISIGTDAYEKADEETKKRWELFSLTENESKMLISLIQYFKIDTQNDTIINTISNAGDFVALTTDLNKETKRLVVFFTVIKLIGRWISFKDNNQNNLEHLELSNQDIARLAPDKDDLLIALNPIAASPLVFYIHSDLLSEIKGRGTKLKSKIKELWTNPLGNKISGIEIKVTEIGEYLDITSIVTDTEKRILEHYITSTDTNINYQSKNCPNWIKNLINGKY